ncbi:hypothetical protein SEA_BRUSACORAM_71 [Mycobacterium phage Brusacoram]|uniref:Uncharacterized protein n=3 Tax=Fishburnevirus TaxID=1983734 RepID=A0A0K1Y696_9CAUD|nr:hypothetical protein SEA_BRUSACORAM_71 [Mycobacterium phage Brusacoram]YP_009964404.1 hypothetical protein I5J40_gp71 [Mycobacterium phage Atcoo]AKY02597.1 hypothetical protein SEA_BRUSACORAM_71 [Mycobacterium phage Brusacoram]ATW59200.1 hypothetical protein SEA_THESPIS_71 [Mycobacterium phage Thespis]QGJ88649.1 hypothetical protein SEA_ATCOO_71 [Mycobacterium phage Atcoo]
MSAPTRHRCDTCGREGVRGFTHTVRGVYVCTNTNACQRRQNMPIWRVRELNARKSAR